MVEGVTQGVIGAVVEIPIRFAEVLVVGNLARWRRQLGALQRQELAGDAGIVAGVLREEGQVAVVADIPGQARRQVVTLIGDMVDGRVAIAQGGAEAVEKIALLVDCTGAVEVDLLVFMAAGLRLHFMAALRLRAAAEHIQHAAGRGLAVDRGGRAAQHGNPLQVPGLDFRVGEGADRQRQAVEELGRHEAAHLQPVRAAVGAITAAHHPGGVAQGIVEARGRAQVQLLAGDHRNRAGCLDQRRVGLAAGGAAPGDMAGGRAPGAFHCLAGVDAGIR